MNELLHFQNGYGSTFTCALPELEAERSLPLRGAMWAHFSETHRIDRARIAHETDYPSSAPRGVTWSRVPTGYQDSLRCSACSRATAPAEGDAGICSMFNGEIVRASSLETRPLGDGTSARPHGHRWPIR